ncbi:MAG: hemerythrin domain-containing protein [Vulcanimicrobiaceae bacterium]
MAATLQSVVHGVKVRMSPDVLTLLKTDHREVNALFLEVEGLGERASAQRFKLADKICKALELHSRFEKTVLYPRMKERVKDRDDREQVLEAFEEHGLVDKLVGEIQELSPRDESLEPKLMVLMENVKHHVKEEEHSLFPVARELFEKEELVEMGKRLMQSKRRAGMAK